MKKQNRTQTQPLREGDEPGRDKSPELKVVDAIVYVRDRLENIVGELEKTKHLQQLIDTALNRDIWKEIDGAQSRLLDVIATLEWLLGQYDAFTKTLSEVAGE